MLTEGIRSGSLSLKKTVLKYICSTEDRILFLKIHFNNNMDEHDWKEISMKIINKEYHVSHSFVEMFKRKLELEISFYLKYALTENDCNMIPEDFIHRIFVMEEKDYTENIVNDALYYQNIPNSILLKYINIIDWRSILRFQQLSENTIDMFSNYLHWPFVSHNSSDDTYFIENKAPSN